MRVLVLTGAGVSAESGIPTFRGKDGYWRNLDPTKLATAEAFTRDPKLVWEWYRERRQRISDARPNAAHEAIARLAQCTDDFLLVTQNVDDLHARGGIPAQKMVQIHGDIFVTRCSRCECASVVRGTIPKPIADRARTLPVWPALSDQDCANSHPFPEKSGCRFQPKHRRQ